MAVTSVSTYSTLNTLLQNMAQAQGSLNNDQLQISSGYVGSTYDQVKGSVEQLTSLDSQVISLTDYQQENSVVISKMQTANTALTQVTQLATNLQSLISSQLSNTTGTASFVQQVQSSLSSLTGLLNTTFAGNYIFGGSSANTAPIKSTLPNPVTIGEPDTTYYQGSTLSPTIRQLPLFHVPITWPFSRFLPVFSRRYKQAAAPHHYKVRKI